MKSRLPLNSDALRRVKETAFNDLFRCMQENKVLDIIAAMRAFGLGTKRMNKYLNAIAEVNRDFREWKQDDVWELRVREELAACGIDYDWLMDDEVKARDFREQKSEVSSYEAGDVFSKMQAFQDYLKDDETKVKK